MNDRPFHASAALLLAAGLVAGTARADNFGRETFPHEVVTTIIAPADDVDDFVFEAGQGFKLSAGVKRAKGSLLSPVLELLGPDGDVLGLADGVTAKPPGKTSSNLKAVLAEGGRFALRVRGQSVSDTKTFLTPWEVTIQSQDIVPGTDVLGLAGHGLVDGDAVEIPAATNTLNTLPGGLVLDGDYFVVQSTTDTFKLSATAGGSAVDLTDAGAGTMALLVTRVPPEIDATANSFLKTAHGLTNGDLVRIQSTTDTIPGGLSSGTDYYVAGATASSFQLAALPGGAAIDLTSAGAGILTVATTHGSTGACTLKWKLTAAKIAASKGIGMAGNEIRQFPFAARGGALVSWTLKWTGEGAPAVTRILDPDGKEVPYDTTELNPYVTRKLKLTSGSETAKKLPLPADRPGGTYKLEVRNPAVPSTVSMAIKVALPKVKAAPVSITSEEPILETIDISPALASTGITVSFTGRGLDSAPQALLFGESPATDVVVTQGATASDPDTVTCKVPVGSGTVPVQFVAADGETGVLPETFTFRPMPAIASFTPDVGPGGGGIEVTLTGEGFETLSLTGIYDVRINNVPAWPTSVRVTSPTTMKCKIPANPAGPHTVEVRNVYSNATAYRVQAPGVFTYSTQLGILYLDPHAVPANFPAGVPVSVYGSGFIATDTVYIEDGEDTGTFTSIPTTPIYFNTAVIGHRIAAADLPVHGPGKYDVKVVAVSLQTVVESDGLSYYAFADATDSLIPAASATDDWGGVSSAVIDDDLDGTVDYLLITHTGSLSASRPGTRLLRNNGLGVFEDRTAQNMPSATVNDDFGGNRILAGRFTSDNAGDFILSRPGTGTSARTASDKKSVNAWARILLGDGSGGFGNQPYQGPGSKFSIPGILVYGSPCFLFDYDFRSRNAALGDLDGDLDQDIVLVNDTSITWYKGVNCAFVWQTCLGYYPSCYSFVTYPVGSATRICTLGSTGGVFDRTKDMLKATFSDSDDFRAVAAAVGDVNADFLNDIIITHNTQPGASGTLPCTRGFKQKNTGNVVTYVKLPPSFVPVPQNGADDDWRGDVIAIPDLNTDLYRDLVISVDGPMFNGGAYSTRILIQDPTTSVMEDKTAEILGGVLPPGDDARASFILAVDLDQDGDGDLVLCTPSSAGAGNRMTRFLLNTGKDPGTGIPVFVDASALFPDFATDPGNATCAVAADVDDDDDLDLILTDTHQTGGTPVKRTRIWRQER